MKNIFLVYHGNNGAKYIINTKTINSILYSLKFYNALNLRSKILKVFLFVSIFFKKFFLSDSYNINEINDFIQDFVKSDLIFIKNSDSSALISPTDDKVTVNFHNNYFQKYAFKKSYYKVKNEVEIYKLFNKSNKFFQISKLSNFYDKNDAFVTFKMTNNHIVETKKSTDYFNIANGLKEFFLSSNAKQILVKNYLKQILKKFNSLKKSLHEDQIYFLSNELNKFKDEEFPLGLVHRDFKAWNIIMYDKPVFFDFEESIVNGPPLEDLFNFFIDPLILSKPPSFIIEYIYTDKKIDLFKCYLNLLNIRIDYVFFLNIYLLNRILFYEENNNHIISRKYSNLFLKLNK